MKFTFLILLFVIIICQPVSAQGIGINTDSPDPSAIIDMKSYSQGILIPRMNSTERNNIESPAAGLMVYDMTTKSFWFHNGGVWNEIGEVNTTADTDWVETANAVYSLKNAGIGITSPNRKLEVGGMGNQYARVTSTNGFTTGFELVRNGPGVDWAVHNSNTFLDLVSSNDQFSNSSIQATFTTNGRFGIGTSNPQEAIHAVGNIRITGLAGSGTRRLRADANGKLKALPNATEYWHVSGAAFNSNSPSFQYGSSAYCTSGNATLSTPIILPEGAVVQELQAIIADYSNSDDLRVILYKMNPSTHYIETIMAEVFTSGDNNAFVNVSDTSIADPIISNQNFYYQLIVAPTSGGSWDGNNLLIRNMRISYTVP